MNFKFAIAASAMMAFAGIFTMVGCGGDACTKAADHLAECLGTSSSTTSASGTTECTGAVACSADCFNAADCDTIKAAFGGMANDKVKALSECSAKCATAK